MSDQLTNKEAREIWCLVRLRESLGDPLGRLMQDELIAHAAAIVAERDRLRAQVENMRTAVHSCHPGCSNARCVAERLRADVAELVAMLGKIVAADDEAMGELRDLGFPANLETDATCLTNEARALLAKHQKEASNGK